MTDPIEIMARAIWSGREASFPPKQRMTWEQGTHVARLATGQHAVNCITALTEAGFAIVPASGSVDMVAAFWRQKNAGTQEVGETGPDTDDMAAMRAAIEAGRVKA